MASVIDKAALVKLIEAGGEPPAVADKVIAMLPVLLVVENAQQGYATIKMAEGLLSDPDADKATLARTVVSLSARLQIVTEDRYAILAASQAVVP